VVSVDGRDVVAIAVPRATRQQRPVYIRSNPLTGTYRRGYEGDCLCGEGEVRRMLAEQSGQALDAAVLDGFGLDDIDQATLKQYRQLWSSRDPGHPWLADEDRPFLENIGAYRVDRQTGHEGLTIAGLLMFGLNRAILDPDGVPAFGVDYRERVSNDLADRWTDRVTYDGKWECNLLQFLQRVLPRLTADIKTPFRLNENLVRIDDTEVHQAVREALVNARVHADYAGQGGIVIEKFRDRLEFANPGTLLISKERHCAVGSASAGTPACSECWGSWGTGSERALGSARCCGAGGRRTGALRTSRRQLSPTACGLCCPWSAWCLTTRYGDFETCSARRWTSSMRTRCMPSSPPTWNGGSPTPGCSACPAGIRRT
jgi:ATP-dependent DNA helicase RecG